MYKYIMTFIVIALIFVGCKNSNQPQPNFTTKSYKNVSKDALLNAAKRVINLSDNKFNILSSSNNITAKKLTPRYKAYTMDLEINTINFTTKSENNITDAKLFITQKHDYFDKNEIIIKEKTHKLFWLRVEYILGLEKTWAKCLKHSNFLNYDGILCDLIYNENNDANSSYIISNTSIRTKKVIEKISTKIDDNIKLDDISEITLPNAISKTQMNNEINATKIIKNKLAINVIYDDINNTIPTSITNSKINPTITTEKIPDNNVTDNIKIDILNNNSILNDNIKKPIKQDIMNNQKIQEQILEK